MTIVLDPEGAHLAALRRLVDFEGMSVLEVGCGEGRLTTGLGEDGATPDDRRAYVIHLTAAGRRAQARAEEAVDAHALEYFGRLSEDERQELHRLLARLIERSE